MFKSGGYNVYPSEIERALEAHPGITMSAVVSVPDATFSEVGFAFFSLTDSTEALHIDTLKDDIKSRLANYKRPKYFHQLKQWPLLSIGKVDKKALKQMAIELTGKSLY